MICSVQFFSELISFSQEKVYILLDRENTKAEFSFLHKMAYTLLARDNALLCLNFNFM